MIKKGILILLGLVLMTFFPQVGNASENGTYIESLNGQIIQKPMFTNIETFENSFSISSTGLSTSYAAIYAGNIDQAKLGIYLQQYNNNEWSTIKYWEESAYGLGCSTTKTWNVINGYYYRMISIGTVYKNGVQIEQTGLVSNTKYF